MTRPLPPSLFKSKVKMPAKLANKGSERTGKTTLKNTKHVFDSDKGGARCYEIGACSTGSGTNEAPGVSDIHQLI